MDKNLKLFLSTLVGLLAYCLTYMVGFLFADKIIGYNIILKNQGITRLSLTLISAAAFVVIFIFIYKLIEKKTLPKKD